MLDFITEMLPEGGRSTARFLASASSSSAPVEMVEQDGVCSEGHESALMAMGLICIQVRYNPCPGKGPRRGPLWSGTRAGCSISWPNSRSARISFGDMPVYEGEPRLVPVSFVLHFASIPLAGPGREPPFGGFAF